MKNLITNRTFEIDGGWYAPERYLNSYKSVIKVILINTTSSAGDWDGLVFQKIGKYVYVIPFSQENRYPYSGFNLYTGDVFTKVFIDNIKKDFTEKSLNMLLEDINEKYCELTY
jgi:hypothetical protein